MQGKKLIISFLLFVYTGVLAHAIVPHGHFDDLFQSEHQKEDQDQHDNDHHKDFPFEHSTTFHVLLDKQSIWSVNSLKSFFKKSVSANPGITADKQFQICIFNGITAVYYHYIFYLSQVISQSLSTRAPPESAA